jgi:SAM-dependent methyltransferase
VTLDATEPTGNEPVPPASFYTGLVAELYAALRSADPDPEPLARFIDRYGTPALELGCGDGDPLLDLRRRGLDIEGLDSSADMLDRCRARAAEAGVDVTLHHSTMESMHLGRRYRSIVIAGPTFNLLVDDTTASAALERIAAHLDPEGAALIPLFVPPVVDQLGRSSETRTPTGDVLRCTPIAVDRNEATRVQSGHPALRTRDASGRRGPRTRLGPALVRAVGLRRPGGCRRTGRATVHRPANRRTGRR